MPTYTSQYPPAQSDTYVKATTTYDHVDYETYFATDPALSLIGAWAANSWLSLIGELTNQRFHIDLGSAKCIRRIYYENNHLEGGLTNRTVNNFTFWGSNIGSGSFDDLVWGNDEGWTELTCSQNTFDEHIALDEADPKYLTITNSTAYRYYAFKFADNHGGASYMGLRHVELQTEDGWTPTFEYVGTGSLTYSGIATTIIGFTYAGSGELTYSGEAIVIIGFTSIGSGTYNFGGIGLYSLGLSYIGSGTYNFGGIGLYSLGLSYEGSGIFNYSGKAVYRYTVFWSKVIKEIGDFTVVEKEKDDWIKVDKEKEDWDKVDKE